MALRETGLSASEASSVLGRQYRTVITTDGIHITSLGKSAYLEARLLDEGVLFVDATNVSPALRGQGISHELFSQTLESVGASQVRSIQSWLTGTNAEIAKSGIARGLSPVEAAALTPRGRTALKFGFNKIDYDPFTGVFSASR